MKRTTTIGGIAVLVLAATVGLAVAAETLGGNARKGKYLYTKNCRTCHGQTASDLSPSSLVQAEWKVHFENAAALPCRDKWPAEMTEADVKDTFSYLYDFAKDSPSPAKCN